MDNKVYNCADYRREIQGEFMPNRLYIVLFVFFAFSLLISACSSGASSSTVTPAATSSQDGATLVQERCSRCHPLTRVENARHTAAQWKSIVAMMISRGAQLNSSEETTVVNYLAANYGQ